MLHWRNSWFQIAFFAWILSGALLVVDYAPNILTNAGWMQAFHRATKQPSEVPAKPSPPGEQQSPAKEPVPARQPPNPSSEAPARPNEEKPATKGPPPAEPATKTPSTSGVKVGSAELAQGRAAEDRKNYAQAMQLYQKSAAQGNADAERAIGWLYENGLGVQKDHAEAMKWYQKALPLEMEACNTGDMRACATAGSDYFDGKGTAPDQVKGLSLLQRSCDGGVWEDGCYNAGAYSARSGDSKTELTFWTKGCNGVASDPRRNSESVFAAESVIAAENNCGNAFKIYAEGGRSIPKDATQALEIAKKWCLANGNQCLDIGDLYRSNTGALTKYGITVSPDRAQAIIFYRKACAGTLANGGSNDTIACLYLKQMNATDKGIAHDYAQALAINRKQCAANGLSCGDLGLMYENGLGIPTDLNKAVELYHKACDGKNEESCAALKRLGK